MHLRILRRGAAPLALLAAAACAEASSGPPAPIPVVTLVGAGDIAECATGGDEDTAALLDSILGVVFTLGDNAYPDGSDSAYAACYQPSWGRHKARTLPVPGNHDYWTPGAAGYFRYFGSAAGEPGRGYYSLTLGDWHIVVLNSNDGCTIVDCGPNSPQVAWLRADLLAHQSRCTLALWHHPRFNSGAQHGNSPEVAPFWEVLYEGGADVVLNGHEHIYERFAPQGPDASRDSLRGLRQFTVGTGGGSPYPLADTPQPNSEVRRTGILGVLSLTLRPGGYDWRFIAIPGQDFTDAGSGSCH